SFVGGLFVLGVQDDPKCRSHVLRFKLEAKDFGVEFRALPVSRDAESSKRSACQLPRTNRRQCDNMTQHDQHGSQGHRKTSSNREGASGSVVDSTRPIGDSIRMLFRVTILVASFAV